MLEVKITIMRTITYLIDDKEGFRKSLTKEQLNLMNDIKGFKVYYTLHEDEEGIMYQLEDMKGNLLNVNLLNGYEKEYIHKCLDFFCKEQKVSDEYKDFIKILDIPRIIKPSVNQRYEIFKNYAEVNKIEENVLNYIGFIDKFSNEFETKYNKSCISNPNEFDAFLQNKLLEQTNEMEDEECM